MNSLCVYSLHHCDSVPGPHDSDDIFKFTASKVKSARDGHEDLVNWTDPEPLKGFKPKFTQIPTVRRSFVQRSRLEKRIPVEAYRLTVCRRSFAPSRLFIPILPYRFKWIVSRAHSMLTMTRYRFAKVSNSSADAAETHLLPSGALLLPRRQRKSIGGNSSGVRTR